MKYLSEHHLLEAHQSAYRPRHSTETALVRVQDDICRAFGDRQVILLVMLDLSAAFDTVNHQILLSILADMGICDLALQWFRSYLEKRKQVVNLKGTRSDHKPLDCGIPQGSVLGPILFTIYSSSLGHLLREKDVGFHLYADDTQLYVSASPEHLHSPFRCLSDGECH